MLSSTIGSSVSRSSYPFTLFVESQQGARNRDKLKWTDPLLFLLDPTHVVRAPRLTHASAPHSRRNFSVRVFSRYDVRTCLLILRLLTALFFRTRSVRSVPQSVAAYIEPGLSSRRSSCFSTAKPTKGGDPAGTGLLRTSPAPALC